MINIWSSQEAHKASDLSISNISVGLDEILGKDLQDMQPENQNSDAEENDPGDDPAITQG